MSGNRNKEDLDILLKGVDIISPQGTSGFLSVYGSNAFPIVAALQRGTKNLQPIIAGARLGQGKIIGTAHGSFFYPDDENHDVMTGRKRFIVNAVEWAGRPGSGLTGPPKVGFLVVTDAPCKYLSNLRKFLAKCDIGLTTVVLGSLKENSDLAKFDVLITNDYLTVHEATILRQYVENGGGLLMGRTGWADKSVKGSEHFGQKFTPNIVTASTGFVYRNDHVYASPETDAGFSVAYSKLINTHVQEAWAGIKSQAHSNVKCSSQFWSVVDAGLRFIPPNVDFWAEINFNTDAIQILLRKSLSIE